MIGPNTKPLAQEEEFQVPEIQEWVKLGLLDDELTPTSEFWRALVSGEIEYKPIDG